MKYTTEAALHEVLRRKEQITFRRCRNTLRALSGIVGILFVLLVGMIAFSPDGVLFAPEGTVYGSFLLSAEAGGYVAAAVIAFALGVCVTLLCLRRHKTADQKTISKVKENV